MNPIPLPEKIEVKKIEENYSKFIIEPCYPGYGVTLGNALRRVLLSSMEGAAITAVKIKDVSHEFSTLPNVKEDIVDIILNLKTVRLKSHSNEPVTVTIKEKGEKKVTAKDIKVSSDVEVANPDQVIATLTDKKAEIEMELRVEKGRGYVPVESREKEKNEIGLISIDAVYTPVRNVNFEIENVRVGQMTNYDKLVLEVTTDGTISPEEAFHQTNIILQEHFNHLLKSVGEEKAEKKTTTAVDTKKKRGRPKKTEKKDETGE